MPNGSILAQIANPATSNIPAQFAAGQQARAQTNLLQQQATSAQGENADAQVARQRSEVAYNVLAAFSAGPGSNRDSILNNVLNKSGDDTATREAMTNLLNTPEGKERDSKLLRMIDFFQGAGYLPKKSAPTKTAGQIERGVVIEEKKLGLLERGKAPKPTKLMKLVDERNQLREEDPNNPDIALWESAASKESTRTGQRITVSPDGTMTVETGIGGGLTKPTETKIQKDVIGLEQQLADLRVVGADFKKEYLTYPGKLKRFALKEADKIGLDLGPGGESFVQGSRRFTEGVEQIFNSYRKEITGAQAAMREISMLRDSILNKKLTPSEFEASFNRYTSQIERGLRLKKHYLSKGLSGTALSDALDINILAGNDLVDIRGDEIEEKLRGDNPQMTDLDIRQEVLGQLKSEGF